MSHNKKKFWIVPVTLLLAAVLSGGYYYVVRPQAASAAPAATVATATVTRGDLTVSASGSGTLEPASEVSIGFQDGGMLSEVSVKVGDTVEAGQTLARLDDTEAQSAVAEAQISLQLAELAQADLAQGANAADVAAAQASLSTAKANLTALTAPGSSAAVTAAQQTLASAQAALNSLLAGPTENDLTELAATLQKATVAVQQAQTAYDKVSWRNDVGMTSEAADLQEATIDYEAAKAAYESAAQGASTEEIASARAAVATAQANLEDLTGSPDPDELAADQAGVDQAQSELDELLAGASASDLETARLDVEQARLTLESAQRALAQATLVSPIAGVVTEIDAQAGETVDSGTFITVADMSHPQLQFWVEENDLSSVGKGNTVSVVFDALPDDTFNGTITSVDPGLVDVDGTDAVQSWASLDLDGSQVTLLSGMNADVEIVAGEAQDALLVPVEALQEGANGQYTVIVVGTNGQLETRQVEVGLKDFVSAQILSGLEEGDVVSLGTTQAAAASTTTTADGDNMPQMPAGAAAGMLGGGR